MSGSFGGYPAMWGQPFAQPMMRGYGGPMQGFMSGEGVNNVIAGQPAMGGYAGQPRMGGYGGMFGGYGASSMSGNPSMANGMAGEGVNNGQMPSNPSAQFMKRSYGGQEVVLPKGYMGGDGFTTVTAPPGMSNAMQQYGFRNQASPLTQRQGMMRKMY